MLLSLVGCAAAVSEMPEEKLSFTNNGIQILIGGEAAPILEALGEPTGYTEEPSCAFDGMNKTYFFGSFYLSTYPLEGKDYIYNLWFKDEGAATEEGIRIGNSRNEVEKVYGRETLDGINRYVLTKGQTRLIILIDDEKVSGVRYEVILC